MQDNPIRRNREFVALVSEPRIICENKLYRAAPRLQRFELHAGETMNLFNK